MFTTIAVRSACFVYANGKLKRARLLLFVYVFYTGRDERDTPRAIDFDDGLLLTNRHSSSTTVITRVARGGSVCVWGGGEGIR